MLVSMAIVKADPGEPLNPASIHTQANLEVNELLEASLPQPIPQTEIGQNGAYYDGSALAALNGQLPPYDSRFPVVDQGYLVPIMVDEDADLSAFPQYQWVDPASHALEPRHAAP